MTTVISAARRALPLPATDAAIGTALVVIAVVSTTQEHGLVHPATELVAAALAGSVLLRTPAPLVMCFVASVAIVAYALLPGTSTPLWTFLVILVLAFSAGARLEGRMRVVGAASLVVAAYLLQVVTTSRLPADEFSWADVYVSPLVIIGGPVLAGWLLQRSQRQTAQVRRLAAEIEAQRETQAEAVALAERNRIARELHDVISHSVSVIVVQAAAAEQLLIHDPALEAVRTIREVGKDTLAELRRQLGFLGGSATGGAAPMPGLIDLPKLVERSGASLQCEGRARGDLAPGLELAVFRVVQEALTNASRHASGARVSVLLVHRHDALEIEVIDTGGPTTGAVGSGRGLEGMQERMAMYGGVLQAGPEGHGWRVHAWVPTGPAAESER